jgi:hypothetical protein
VLAGLGPEGASFPEWRAASGSSRTTFDRHKEALVKAGRVIFGEDGRFRVVQAVEEPELVKSGTPAPLSTPETIPAPGSSLTVEQEGAMGGSLLLANSDETECVGSVEQPALPAVRDRTELAWWKEAKEGLLRWLNDGMTEEEWRKEAWYPVEFSNFMDALLESGGVTQEGGRFYKTEPKAA